MKKYMFFSNSRKKSSPATFSKKLIFQSVSKLNLAFFQDRIAFELFVIQYLIKHCYYENWMIGLPPRPSNSQPANKQAFAHNKANSVAEKWCINQSNQFVTSVLLLL
jgi:hypothetical protein